MTRRIFVGSSTESLQQAHQVCEVLNGFDETQAVPWETVFTAGLLTFEALEDMMHRCCAAVFIATPDDEVIVRDRKLKSPRANVLLEFGLVAGRIGRHSIALCRFNGAELPTDLKGLTVIEMGQSQGPEQGPFSPTAIEELRRWNSRLIATPDTIARTDVFHGYTGRWHFELRLERWRDRVIAAPSYAQVNGSLDLIIPSSGQAGSGMTQGQLLFKIADYEHRNTYEGEFRTVHAIRDAFCKSDGGIEFVTQAFVVQSVRSIGAPPPELAGMDTAPEPWSSRWCLQPTHDPRTLQGVVVTDSSAVTEGHVRLTKDFIGQ
jgi:Predicted nucleotide-binding protein containing TIR-like domain